MVVIYHLAIMFVLGMCAGVGLLILIQETRPHIHRERKARNAAMAELWRPHITSRLRRKAREAFEAELRG